jgi:hypothetical protein
VADRRSAPVAREWGVRLAAAGAPVAPWRAPGKVAWLSVADLRRVPAYARDSARDRIRERESARSAGERRLASPLLLYWDGRLAERFGAEKGEALLVLLSAEHEPVTEFRGAPTDETAARLREAIDRVAGP